MNDNLLLVKVDSEYCDYLRKFDPKVPFNFDQKKLRPFVGILFNIDAIKYFAPLSSPRAKHLKLKDGIDVLKIKKGELGVINFNNMIPVTEKNYEIIDLNYNSFSDKKYYFLLDEQIKWLNENKKIIYKKSRLLYNNYARDRLSSNLKARCCDFILLELKCREYNDNLIKI